MIKNIKKVAVLGSGIMGSGIACQLANVGLGVILLDIVPENEKNSSDHKKRNSLVNSALNIAVKSKPAPLYSKSMLNNITTGNFDDDFDKISECDWIIEVVVERLDIKNIIFEKVDQHRKAGSIVSSNTSGIPINSMLDNRTEDFKSHFLGTHFFNPPRYLKLLEIIPTSKTNQEVVDFMMEFGGKLLGKTTVLCKDTPSVIAKRGGLFAIQDLLQIVYELNLSVTEVDSLTGPIMGRPKSATFRTCDVVGLDTLIHVANGLKENCPNDERSAVFILPSFIAKMKENNWLGSKTGQGFYKKTINESGKKEILELDLKTFEYKSTSKTKFETIGKARGIDNLKKRTKVLFNGNDKAGDFYRRVFAGLLSYASHRIPEISDEIYRLDEAMKAGFGWELGPFEIWDAIGIKEGIANIEKVNLTVPDWVISFAKENESFYRISDGKSNFYDLQTKKFQPISGSNDVISLSTLDTSKTIW